MADHSSRHSARCRIGLWGRSFPVFQIILRDSCSATSGCPLRFARRLHTAFVLLAFTSSGCGLLPSHIHNSDRATRTDKLVALVDQYEKSPGVYDTLLKSSRTVAAEQDKLLAGLAANRTEAYTTMLPLQTGKELAQTRGQVINRLNDTRTTLQDDVNAYLRDKAGAEGNAKTAAEAIADAEAKVNDAQAEVTNWNKTIAVIETGVAALPSIDQSKSDSKKAGVDKLHDQISAVAGTSVSYVDANGVTQQSTIGEVLKSQINLTGDGKPLLNIPDAPGATVAILTLGVDLARVQKQAAEGKLAQLSQRLRLYERVQAEGDLAEALLEDIDNLDVEEKLSKNALIVGEGTAFDVEVVRLAEKGRASEQAGLEAAKSGSEDKQRQAMVSMFIATDGMTSRLIELRELAIAQAIATRTSMDLAVGNARLAHEESILDSQVNDVAWRAVIRSGVVVLNQYEQGGFTSQDAADIIAIAQSIAVGIIAGRVH